MDNPNKPLLIVILGPTACGKTKLAVSVAKAFNGEVVSGDSMQVYRRMDIGTAKVTAAEAQGIPHWLIDIREPDEGFSVAEFRSEAVCCINAILDRGHLPIVCGGTGLYINSLINVYHFSAAGGADVQLRSELRKEFEQKGALAMHERLREVDPAAAERIHANDSRRTLRALEVWYSEGVPLSRLWEMPGTEPPYRPLLIGLTADREALYERIEQRIDAMLEQGLVDEVAALLSEGTDRNAVSMQGLGYRQIAAYLDGECSLEDAVIMLKRDTRRFAKRQLTWFKRDERINWYNVDHYRDDNALLREVRTLIEQAIKESDNGEGIAGTIP